MKYILVLAVVFMFVSCQDGFSGKTEMKTQVDSISYSLGVSIGKDLKEQSFDINPKIVARAMVDVLTEQEQSLTDEQIAELMNAMHMRMMDKQKEGMKEMSEKNLAEGKAFLEANKSKQGVVTLPSGLQYKVIKMGTGKKPKSTQTVSVHYKGTLIDGTEFDSSYKRDKPVTFEVTGVIKGFSEALLLMPVGSKWIIYVPSELAYGEQGAGAVIPPNATIIFELELISVL